MGWAQKDQRSLETAALGTTRTRAQFEQTRQTSQCHVPQANKCPDTLSTHRDPRAD